MKSHVHHCEICKELISVPDRQLLIRVWKIAIPMLVQMKLINGPDEKCVIKEWKECSNHRLIHEMEDAIDALK